MTLKYKNFIISAPSGTGKTTINRRLVSALPELELSISSTTRPRRPNEVDGDHYYFVSKEEFSALIKSHTMLEWAQVFDNFYGTNSAELQKIYARGHAALLEIDVQGWAQAKPLLADACSIFLLPPSIKALWERLQGRGTDSLEMRRNRFLTARKELAEAHLYEHFVINDTIETAFTALTAFIRDQVPLPLSTVDGLAFSQKLQQEFDQLCGEGLLP
jgi:guanylate kinase